MSRGLSATQRQALALLVASKRPLDVTEELLPELGLSRPIRPGARCCGRCDATGGVRAVRGGEARGWTFGQVGAERSRPARPDVQDRSPLALGGREPARPRRPAAARRPGDGDARRVRRGRSLEGYRELEERAEGEDAYWYAAARRMTTIALSTGMRRGELLGLRWQDVDLLAQRLHVRQAFVRNEITTPKSKAGRRMIDLGAVALSALEEQFTDSRHRAPSPSCSPTRRSARRSIRRS